MSPIDAHGGARRAKAKSLFERMVSQRRRAAARRVYGLLSRRLRARERLLVTVLLLCAAGLRVVFLAQLWPTPRIRNHERFDTDMAFFHEWATRVSQGELLFREGLHPYHPWHEEIARWWLTRHGEPFDEQTARDLWRRWYGGPRYHQEPLYPYAVGLILWLCDGDYRIVFIIQAAMGVISIGLIYWFGRLFVGRLMGFVGATMAAICGPFLVYEAALLRCAPSVLALSLFFLLLARARRRARTGVATYAGLGLTLGALCLLRVESLALGAMAMWSLARGRPARMWAPRLCAMALAAALCLAPVIARNAVVGAPLLGLTSIGAITAIVANEPGYWPLWGWTVDWRFAASILNESDGKFLPSLLLTLEHHRSAGELARFFLDKLLVVFHWYETPNNLNFYQVRETAPVLQLAGMFVTVAYPALLGMALAWWRRRRLEMLYVGIILGVLRLTIFYSIDRLRLPLVPLLAPFAGLAIVYLLVFLASFLPTPAARRIRLTAPAAALSAPEPAV